MNCYFDFLVGVPPELVEFVGEEGDRTVAVTIMEGGCFS